MGQRQSARGRCYGELPPPPRKALRGAGVTLVCELARRGERWPDTAETKQPGWGPIARVADIGIRASASAPLRLCSSAGVDSSPARAQSLRSAPRLISLLSPRACHPRADISVHSCHHDPSGDPSPLCIETEARVSLLTSKQKPRGHVPQCPARGVAPREEGRRVSRPCH